MNLCKQRAILEELLLSLQSAHQAAQSAARTVDQVMELARLPGMDPALCLHPQVDLLGVVEHCYTNLNTANSALNRLKAEMVVARMRHEGRE